MWDFPYATMYSGNCIYYKQKSSEVINGMIYGFNFTFCYCKKIFFICEDNQDEGANVINVACASCWPGVNPMAVSQQKTHSPSSNTWEGTWKADDFFLKWPTLPITHLDQLLNIVALIQNS